MVTFSRNVAEGAVGGLAELLVSQYLAAQSHFPAQKLLDKTALAQQDRNAENIGNM